MPVIHIQGGRIIDPASGRDEVGDLWAVDGKVVLQAPDSAPDTVIDASGKVVAPGFIDMHVHLREPGREDKETIASGTRAAAAGGYTSIVPMPNTSPVIDSQTGVKFILSRSQTDAVVNVLPSAALTVGQKGEEITEFGDLIEAGAVALTDDGMPVMNNEIMRRALEYSSMFDVPILDHCEDMDLAREGLMHEGKVSTQLGLAGWPTVAESIQVSRDVELARYTGGRIHICHVSTAASVEAIRQGKKLGVRVTGECTPHHIALTEAAVRGYDTHAKCKPPIASEEDRQAVIAGLLDDTLEVIATDHAPHTVIEKDLVFSDAPFGLIGMETALGVLISALVVPEILSLPRLIEKLTSGPARVLGIEKGSLAEGADADITVFDPDRRWNVDVEKFFSASRNCPWAGQELVGQVTETLVGGRIIFDNGNILV